MMPRSLLILLMVVAGNLGLVQPALANKTLLATIEGENFYQKEFLNKSVKRKYRLHYAVNTFRVVAERKLIELRLPACELEPSADEISDFIEWWRSGLQGIRTAFSEIEGTGKTVARGAINAIDESLNSIANESERARSAAATEIEPWLRYNCIQEQYQGDRFFIPDGPFDRAAAREFEKSVTAMTKKGGLYFPISERLPEPVASIGAFFEAAEKAGQLSIPDQDRRDYFFSRYKSEQFGNRSAEDVLEELTTPYWRRSH